VVDRRIYCAPGRKIRDYAIQAIPDAPVPLSKLQNKRRSDPSASSDLETFSARTPTIQFFSAFIVESFRL